MKETLIYIIGDCQFTPFESSKDILKKHRFSITENFKNADILVSKFLPKQNLIRGLKFLYRFGNKTPLLIWSAEPRDFPVTVPILPKNIFYPDIHVMNMYTGGVYRSPGSYYGYNADQTLLPMSFEEYRSKQGFAVFLGTYVNNTKFIVNGLNSDLLSKRQTIAISGFKNGLVDIFGSGWPEGVSKGFSGHKHGWVEDKINRIRHYKFNICLENTAYPMYITEKIWQAIKGRCLPLYSSYNSSIYEIFPKKSFIDIEEFSNFDEIFNYLKTMPINEYLERYNRCIEAFNNFYDSYKPAKERDWILEQIIIKLQEIRDKFQSSNQTHVCHH